MINKEFPNYSKDKPVVTVIKKHEAGMNRTQKRKLEFKRIKI